MSGGSWLVLWQSPWNELASLGSYASNTLGLIVIVTIVYWLTILFVTLILFFLIAATSLSIPKLKFITIIRYLLVTGVSAIVVLILSLLLAMLLQFITPSMEDMYRCMDASLTQLATGISYYYVVSLFLKESESSKNNILEETSNE